MLKKSMATRALIGHQEAFSQKPQKDTQGAL
jgi:hypothetical protein